MAWYVKFDGVTGSSSNKDHLGWIAASIVKMNSTTAFERDGSSRPRKGNTPLKHIGIINDAVVAKLFDAVATGRIFPKVQIHSTDYFDAVEKVYYELELKNVLIASAQSGALDKNDKTNDAWLVLHFAGFKSVSHYFGTDKNRQGNEQYSWNAP